MPKHHQKTAKKQHGRVKRVGGKSCKMRGGSCAGTSGCGTMSFGTSDMQMAKLNSDMHGPSNNATNLLTGQSACGMTGGKYHKKSRGKKHGGSGLTAIAVPALLVAANQMYSRKGRKGKSMRRRRSMRVGGMAKKY